MPYLYEDPKTVVVIGDVYVCHCYHSRSGMALEFHYQVFDEDSSTSWTAFDIRDVAHELGLKGDPDHVYVIRTAFHAAMKENLEFLEWLREHELDYEGEG